MGSFSTHAVMLERAQESDSEATGTDGTDLGSASEEDDEMENEGDEIAIDVK